VNRVAQEGALRETALEVARSIAANGPVAVRAAKDAVDRGVELPIEQGLEHEAACYERTLVTEDRLEALAAFAEKRPPRYAGR
jgi:methylglutaconyl-CoA hydratase